jgi:glycerol uptake facilitator-like aquaporin
MSQAKYSLGQRLFAEWLGSMLLVVVAISPTILGFNALKSGVPLAVVMDAFAVWLVLFVLITILGPVSYCHINPSVTIAMMATKNIEVKIGVLYIIVQLIGGLCGTLASHAMFIGNDFFQWMAISTNVRNGGVYFAEFLGTFVLNLTIFALMHHKTEQAHRAGFVIASIVGGLLLTTSSTMFANPQVTFARIFTWAIAGVRPFDAGVFIVVQIAAALTAAGVSRILFSERLVQTKSRLEKVPVVGSSVGR